MSWHPSSGVVLTLALAIPIALERKCGCGEERVDNGKHVLGSACKAIALVGRKDRECREHLETVLEVRNLDTTVLGHEILGGQKRS